MSMAAGFGLGFWSLDDGFGATDLSAGSTAAGFSEVVARYSARTPTTMPHNTTIATATRAQMRQNDGGMAEVLSVRIGAAYRDTT